MPIIQYPYTLQVLVLSGPTQNQDGDNILQVKEWVDYCACRDEDGNGKMIRGVDGNAYVFSFLIQMPRVDALQPGTEVRIIDNGLIRRGGKVLFSRKDQMHSRAWV